MPIYEFECGGCGHRFDRLQKMSDADPSACPQCAADGTVHRRDLRSTLGRLLRLYSRAVPREKRVESPAT